jgi:hypothetical protein
MFNLVLPGFGNYEWIMIGPLSTTIFLAAMAYSINKHKLFDVQGVVVRSLAYSLTIAAIALIYGVLVFAIGQKLFGLDLSPSAELFFAITTALVALAFQSFRSSFDRFTNRYFFRDSYDPQELLDKLNKILVSNAALKQLLEVSTETIKAYLKTDFVIVGLKGQNEEFRVFGAFNQVVESEDVQKIRLHTVKMDQPVIVARFLTNEYIELKNILDRYKISVLVRLLQGSDIHHEGLGYLAIGAKRSGTGLTNQDLRLLETISGELGTCLFAANVLLASIAHPSSA